MSIIRHYDNKEEESVFLDDRFIWADCEDELWEHKIIYKDGHAIKIIEKDSRQFFVIGYEDDGHIWFKKYGDGEYYEHSFHPSKTKTLIEILQIALKKIELENGV